MIRAIAWMALASSGLAGCDPLLVQPGSTLAIRPVDPETIAISQRVEPVAVEFEVDGCDRFEVRAIRRDDLGGVFQRLRSTALGGGFHVAEVPVAFVAGDRCDADDAAPRPVSAILELSCLDDGRRVESAPIEFAWSAGLRHATMARPARWVLPDPAGGGAFFTSSSDVLAWHLDGRPIYRAPAVFQADVRPRIARGGDRVWVWAGCPQLRCPDTTVLGPDGPEGDIATVVYRYDTGDTLRSTGVERVVPGAVAGLTTDADGGLSVVSTSHDRVYTTAFAVDGASDVVVHPRRVRPTDLARDPAGRLVFMTLDADDSGRAWLYSGAGADWVGQRVDLPSSPSSGRLSLSPDGRRWVLIDGRRIWLAGDDRPWRPVPHDLAILRAVAWSDRALVLHDDDAVEVHPFDLMGDPMRVDHAALVADGRILQSVAVTPDGMLALVTDSGVRLVSPDGVPLGGIDPVACAERVDGFAFAGDRALIAAGEHALWLDLTRYRAAGPASSAD